MSQRGEGAQGSCCRERPVQLLYFVLSRGVQGDGSVSPERSLACHMNMSLIHKEKFIQSVHKRGCLGSEVPKWRF